jgi:hypothetical protein
MGTTLLSWKKAAGGTLQQQIARQRSEHSHAMNSKDDEHNSLALLIVRISHGLHLLHRQCSTPC